MSRAITPHGSMAMGRLIEEGVIPRLCRKMTLICDVNRPITMQLEVLITEEQMTKIADALIENPEEAKAFAREIIFHELVTGKTAEVKL